LVIQALFHDIVRAVRTGLPILWSAGDFMEFHVKRTLSDKSTGNRVGGREACC
jgi:hypothetical protein